MNTIRTATLNRPIAALLAAHLGMWLATASAQSLTWNVKVSPAGGGVVNWQCNSPAATGQVTSSGSISVNVGALLDMTFQPNAGWELTLVMKNADNWTPFLDSNHHFQFGPVSNPHQIFALFTALVPTGTFVVAFPPHNGSLAPVYDVSGNYQGRSPTRSRRRYNFDVAMDEAGRLAAMGTVEGIATDSGPQLSGQGGTVKTVNNVPTATLKGSFSGTKDGTNTTASGSITGSVEPTDLGGGTNGVRGTGSFKSNIGGVPFSGSNLPAHIPLEGGATNNLTKAWSIQLQLAKKTVQGKEGVYASARLTLPNGDVISYPDRPAKYSAAKGYSLSFKGGTNTSVVPPSEDRTSQVSIRGMTMTQVGSSWQINGGTISYRFLGQRGTGNLTDFIK